MINVFTRIIYYHFIVGEEDEKKRKSIIKEASKSILNGKSISKQVGYYNDFKEKILNKIRLINLFLSLDDIEIISQLVSYTLLKSLNGKNSKDAKAVIFDSVKENKAKKIELENEIIKFEELRTSESTKDMKEFLNNPVMKIAKQLIRNEDSIKEEAKKLLIETKRSEVHDIEFMLSNLDIILSNQ